MNSENIYIKATSVEQACSIAKEHGRSFRYLAGGTDVMVNKSQGNDQASVLIDILGIEELKQITVTNTHLVIGALVCLEELKKHPFVVQHFPVLAEAVESVASPTLRKTATLGGNLLCENRCIFYNQSEWWREAAAYCLKCGGPTCLASGGTKNCFAKFVSDTAVALISLEAMAEIYDKGVITKIPLENIYTGDGIRPRHLDGSAIIRAVHFPLHQEYSVVFKKLRKRETLDFTSLTTSVSINKPGKIRIVLGGVHAKPVLVEGFASDDLDSLIASAISQTRVVDNDTYSRAYRKEMITVFLKRSFKELKIASK